MGSDRHYPEEAPVHRATVDGFWMDRTPVTNRQFRQFVEATGHVTFAETAPDPKDYPGALPHMLKAGSLAFAPPKRRVDLRNWGEWWTFKFGANWRRPYGPGSSIRALDEHPVVHVAEVVHAVEVLVVLADGMYLGLGVTQLVDALADEFIELVRHRGFSRGKSIVLGRGPVLSGRALKVTFGHVITPKFLTPPPGLQHGAFLHNA
jgi:hypothetical protein